jgi:hypothetical protein
VAEEIKIPAMARRIKKKQQQLGVEVYTCPSTQRAEAGGLVESRSLGPDWETQ